MEEYRLPYEDVLIPANDTMDPYIIVREEIYPEFSKQYSVYEEHESFYRNVQNCSPEGYARRIMENLLPQKVTLSLAEIETATQYHIRNAGRWGYIIVESTNRIIFYCDYEG